MCCVIVICNQKVVNVDKCWTCVWTSVDHMIHEDKHVYLFISVSTLLSAHGDVFSVRLTLCSSLCLDPPVYFIQQQAQAASNHYSLCVSECVCKCVCAVAADWMDHRGVAQACRTGGRPEPPEQASSLFTRAAKQLWGLWLGGCHHTHTSLHAHQLVGIALLALTAGFPEISATLCF